jgi:hypothetical protein
MTKSYGCPMCWYRDYYQPNEQECYKCWSELTTEEKFNSLDEFAIWVRNRNEFMNSWKELNNTFLWKILKEITSYREEFLQEQRERDYNALEEQKEID